MPNKKGLWLYQEAFKTGKKIYDFRKEEETGIPADVFTYSDLKDFFDIKLSDQERKDLIVAFKISRYTRGCVPLYIYDFEENKVVKK